MRILITGTSGAVGAALTRSLAGAHELRALSRDPDRVDAPAAVEVVRGDALSGEGLQDALEGIEVAYYLIHSMEPAGPASFVERDRAAARRFAAAAAAAGVGRIVYLGGLLPPRGARSAHLASRAEVERILRDAVPASVCLRASIVIGARSQSFRAIVHLIERLPAMPLPPWRRFRTQPIDERDAVAYLAAAATATAIAGESLDIAGPEVLSYGAMIERIAALLLRPRATTPLPSAFGALGAALAARISSTPSELLGPLMAGLNGDLLADDARARELLSVRLHGFDAAVEHALCEWEAIDPGRAR